MFAPEKGAVLAPANVAYTRPLTAADLDKLFALLSKRLIENPKFRLPDNQTFQTTIVVHGGAVFVKLIQSRDTTDDIDYLAEFTDALLENKGIEDAIVLISEEISAIAEEEGLDGEWMNFEGDAVIAQIGDIKVIKDQGIDVINLIGAQPVQQNVVLYEDAGLKVYVMEWCWAFCRKLDRFSDKDKGDILALLDYIAHPATSSAREGDTKGAASKLWVWIETPCPLQVVNWQMRNFEEKVKERISVIANAFKDE